jgi:hypothetical protein
MGSHSFMNRQGWYRSSVPAPWPIGIDLGGISPAYERPCVIHVLGVAKIRYKKIVSIDIALRPTESPQIDKLVMVMKVMFLLFLCGGDPLGPHARNVQSTSSLARFRVKGCDCAFVFPLRAIKVQFLRWMS